MKDRVHERTCVHVSYRGMTPVMCGQPVKTKVQHGWLCGQHYVTDGPKKVQIGGTIEAPVMAYIYRLINRGAQK